MLDKHYYGLALSVRITLDRLRGAEGVFEADREGALALLAMLTLLDRAQTPVSLLSGHTSANMLVTYYAFQCRGADVSNLSVALAAILSDAASLERARGVCVQHGLLRDPGEGSDGAMGVMHQLVQRCLRHELVTMSPTGSVVVGVAREVLSARFTYNTTTPPAQWPAMRRLAPCVQAWAERVCGDVSGGAVGDTAAVAAGLEDGKLLTSWGLMLNKDGDATTAERVLEMALAFTRRVLPPDHPFIATSMNNLARTYSDLGRHEDALKMKEDVLEFERRVLPPDHRDIATPMGNLATTLAGNHARTTRCAHTRS
jgi:hypothetical protein